jgi:hypothetical protein
VNTSFVFPADQFTMIHTVSPFIPLGKKLVVQSLSFQMYLTDDRIPTEVNATIGDPAQGARFYVRMDLQGEGGDQKRFTGNVAPNVAMGQGEDIRLEFWRNDDGGVPAANFVRVAVVGYLVDAGV